MKLNPPNYPGGSAAGAKGIKMPILHDLPDTRRKRVAKFFRNPSQCVTILRNGLAGIAANDNGAISAWVDKHGHYRVKRDRFMVTQDSQQFTSQKALRAWLEKALRQIE